MSGRGLKLGVIGAGVMGRNHARIASTLSGIDLIFIADPDPSKAAELPDILRPKLIPDHSSLLSQVEAVIIASPTQTHYQLAKETISAGKHLLVEKPFTGDPVMAAELVALAAAKGVVLSIGFIELFNPAFQKLLKLIKGEKLHGIDIKRFSPFPERITDTNVIFDMMVHDLHLLQKLVSDEIVALKADGKKVRSKTLDQVTAVITYKNGLIARLESNRVFGSKTRIIAITLEKSVFDADLLLKRIYLRDFSSPSPTTIPVKAVDQLTEEQEDFFSAIKGKSPLLSSPGEAVAALKLARDVELACS